MPDQPEVEELPDETEAPAGATLPEKATDRILWLLRHRHTGRRAEEWALFTELRSAVGFGPARYLDLLALGTWKSSNYRAIAYEVKVSRSDFARELTNPEKRAFAESIAEECYFATPAGLLRPDEVPEGWGLIVAQANGLKVVKRPTQRAPRPWPREFVCAMARRAADPPIPPVPGKLWTFGGRELDLEDVQALCRDLLPQEIGRQVSEKMAAWKKVAQQELSYDESHYRALIAHEMGVKPADLTMWAARRWIHNLAAGRFPSRPAGAWSRPATPSTELCKTHNPCPIPTRRRPCCRRRLPEEPMTDLLEPDAPAPEWWRPACDDRRVYTRFDFDVIDMVRPNDGWNITRCLDVILYFLELGDQPQYTDKDRWTSYDLGAHMSGVGRGADYNDPLTLSNCHDAWQAVRWAVLGGGRAFVKRWRKDNRIHVDETHRVVTNHVRSSVWNQWQVLDRFLAGPHCRPGVRLGDRPGTLLLVARPIGDGRGRRWRWNLCPAGWRHKGAVVTQETGETADAMLTRAGDYLAGMNRPGAAFVDWDFSGGGGGWHYALYRMGAQESEDRATWEKVSETFENVNDAVKSAISLNNRPKEGAK